MSESDPVIIAQGVIDDLRAKLAAAEAELKEYQAFKERTKNRLNRMREIAVRWGELGETECESIYRSAVLELELVLNEK